jgi:hypothetical protein
MFSFFLEVSDLFFIHNKFDMFLFSEASHLKGLKGPVACLLHQAHRMFGSPHHSSSNRFVYSLKEHKTTSLQAPNFCLSHAFLILHTLPNFCREERSTEKEDEHAESEREVMCMYRER